MDEIKRVGIVGAGALGIMYACQIVQYLGRDNVYILADDSRISRYKREGIYSNGSKCDFHFASTDNPSGEKVDLLLFCTKFTTLPEAVAAACLYADRDTILISVLNGIASEEVIGDALGYEHLLYCQVHGMDATKTENRVMYNKIGSVVFGDGENRITHDVELVKKLMDRVEISAEIPEDIHLRLWSKLMLNTGINQVTAIYGLNYGGVQTPGPARDMMILTMEETMGIANLEGISLTREDIDKWLAVTDTLTPNGKTSLCQDMLAGRKTEVELFAGTIRRLGRKHGVPTPLNDFLYDRIIQLEQNGGLVNNV